MSLYTHQEYPKWVKGDDGKEQIVQNEAEELQYLEDHASQDAAKSEAPEQNADDGESTDPAGEEAPVPAAEPVADETPEAASEG